VIAKEPCSVLEIKGEEFLKLAHTYPDIAHSIAFRGNVLSPSRLS
jgi:CRP-like cAMP-binding protein